MKTKPPSTQSPMQRVLGSADFRLLFSGAAASLLGDQFALIAVPWLVLQLTNDPFVLGIILALEGFPRALFMLLGGAITDRVSPRIVMLVSDLIRLILTALMVLASLTGMVHIWMLYAFSLGFGLVSGFAIPAANSIVPRLVKTADLSAGNSLMMGSDQLIRFVGPTIAGILIGGYSHSNAGVTLALAIDAITFAISALCLWFMRGGDNPAAENGQKESLWASIQVGIRAMWIDPAFRFVFLLLAAINFLFTGPILVGIPVLANQRLPEGATAYGLLMSAVAGGNLIGFVLAGVLPRPSGKTLSSFLIVLFAAMGGALAVFGFIPSTWIDCGLLLLLGMGNGYIALTFLTWMQNRTPKEMLGRIMSLVMLSGNGLIPISQAISGALSKSSLDNLFISAGILILLVVLWAAFQPGLKAFAGSLSNDAAELRTQQPAAG